MPQYLSTLEKSWFELHQHYHFSEPQKVFNKLIAAYSEKQRAYHTLQHLYECLVLVDSIRADLIDADAVELALWFHDAVYDTALQDNEERSACLAEQTRGRARPEEPCGVRTCFQVDNWQALNRKLVAEEIEFFVADTRQFESDPDYQVHKLTPQRWHFCCMSRLPRS